ncbi:MAG: hypothetical protein K2J80_06540 [Oscillospiraceae bacterium]|nr:hypothetical protein [Oscillospiraceae bacterium]
MSYIEEFKSVLFGYAKDVQKYLSGDKSDYVYSAETSAAWGTFDKNYTNRARLCYALLYNVCEVPDKKAIVCELFLEELKDRETNSFQGVGDNLETLSSLLLELGEPSDSELFVRAKEANFDCACGYEPRVFKVKPLDEFSLYECINTLSDWGERELMFKLTDEFKSGELDLKGLEELRSVAKWCTKRDSDREFAATQLYKILKTSPELFEKTHAVVLVEEFVDVMLENGGVETARAAFIEQKARFNMFERSRYEVGAKLIASGAKDPEKIWADILPHIKEDLKRNMVSPVNRGVILAAAELAGDADALKKLKKYYEKREYPAVKMYETFQKSPELFDIIQAFHTVGSYIKSLIKNKDAKTALAVFNEQKELIDQFPRGCYVIGAGLIAGGAKDSEKIWADILPHIQEDLQRGMIPLAIRDVILAAAKLARDGKTSAMLTNYFQQFGNKS